MKAYYKNKHLVEVIQWCNDWFSIDYEGKSKVVSPTTLIFDKAGMIEIIDHKNNGVLFLEYEKVHRASPDTSFNFGFKRK